MADEQTSQHTRVLVVNGQTIIVQEDAEVDSVSEINGDLLQQALQEVSTSDQAEGNSYPSAPIPETEETDNSNFVAIFQGDQGETHTIQLTVEQAEALGLHFSVDDEKEIHGDPQENGADDSNLYISDEQNNPLLFSGSSKPSNNGPMFSNEMDTEKTCQEMVQNSRIMGNNSNAALQSNCENMGMIPSTVNSLMDEQNQPITLIPQFLDGQMTYTVKIQNQSESSILQDQEYTNINANIKYMTLQQSNDNATLSNITDFGSSAIQSLCSSASINTQANPVYTTSLPSAVVQQSCSLPVKQTVSLTNSYQNNRTSVTYVPSEKDTKVSYVILPESSTNTNTLVAPKTVSNNNLSRLSTTYAIASGKNESLSSSGFLPNTVKSTAALPILSTGNSETSIAVSVPSTSLAAASKLNSNAVIVSSSGILTTTPTGSGMIRVVASTPTNCLTQALPSYAKFTTIRTAAGNQLLTTTTATTTSTTTTTTTSVPKIVSISTSAATVTSEAVSSMVSAAFTRMPVPNFNSAKPLGSCENPIQLVQHGQTFHSMQSLTQEQLRQIATVLQQQQNLEAPSRTKNVVYDEQTNTRIIYRVVYPEDLDLRDPRSPSDNKSLGSGASSTVNKGRGRRGRPPKSTPRGGIRSTEGRRVGPTSSSADMDFDEDRLILDDSAKGERKKQLARTRSGRLSRPPRHMVKDYKRLHHLDFADADLDDSDGGYSDYQMSEHETEENAEKPNNNKDLLPGLSLPKRKISSHFRCPTCQKVYLGYSRMSRHFEMYPDHGNIEQIQMPNKNNITDTKNDENQQTPDIISNEALTKVSINNAPTTIVRKGLNGIVRTGPARRRGKRRGPWAYTTPEARSERRKGKLREVLATCEAHELAEVAGPAVAEVLSLWELLLLRVEAVRTEESYVATLCDELQALLEKVRAVATDILKPLDHKIENKEHQIELQDELLCTTLGVAMGTYLVDDAKLQRIEPVDEPAQKRARLMDDTTAVEEPKQKENEISNSTSNDKIYEKCNIRAAKPSVVHCPEILSSLTLVTKQPLASLEHDQDRLILSSRTSSSEDKKVTVSASPKGGDFILSGESSDACPKLNVSVKSDGDMSSEVQMPVPDQPSSEFSNASDQQTHDIQTVDDIVNERLKNLTSDSSLVDFSTPTIGVATSSKQQSSVVSSSHDLMDRLEEYHSLPSLPADMPGGAVSTFDPEIALAAMGEGDQGPTTESAQHFSNTLQQMEDVQSDSSTTFDPEAALAAMGEGEQSSAQDPQPPFHNTMQKTYTAGNSSQVSHTQFQNPVSQMDGMTTDQRQSFDPEIALAAMGEGEQTGDESTTTQFQSIRIGTSEETFDPEAALAAIGEGEQSAANSASNTFLSDQVTVSKASDNVNGFDALTAISQRHSTESSHISYPSGTASGSSDSSFHPELALADITEVRPVQTTVPSEGSTSVSIVNSGTFHLQCGPDLGLADASMDVSLDESGPELDFEALSEEFNRNTRHR